jgi:MFS family permease
MTNCEKCGKQLVQGVKKCGYCGHPAPEIITPPSEDSKNIWNELSSLTQLTIIILIPLAILGNFIAGIIGALIGYFWLAPSAANFAKEHNRSINWGYFFGFLGPLSCVVYWLYVKLTTDPLVPSNSSYQNETTIGEWLVLTISLIYAFIATFSGSTNGSIANILGVFMGSFILSLIVLFVIYWIITKLYPKSKYWGIISWILAILGITVVLIIVAAFILGMAGSISNTPYSSIPTVVSPLAPSVLSGNGSFIQSPLSTPQQYSKTIGDWQFTLTSNYAYSLSGKIVGRQEYPATMPNGIIPLDLAVVNGNLIRQDILPYFKFTMGPSSLSYNYDLPASTGLTEKYIDEHISLNRLVFLNPELEREVKKAQIGSCLVINGKLVNIRGNSADKTFSITTSTVRNDFYPTGAEVILIESYTPVSCGT